MLARSWYFALGFLLESVSLIASSAAHAQLVATRDLTQPLPPSPTSAQLGKYDEDYKVACSGSGQADGEVIDKRRDDHLGLSIVDAQPEIGDGQPRISITLRLKNLNVYVPAEVPWEIAPVAPVQTDPHNDTFTYEAASIWVRMAVTKTTREIAELRGGVTFWAQPENPVQHLKLRPGEWVDLKFSVDVVCKSIDEQVCSRYLNGDAVQLTAWWYERDLTHLRVGCKITDSAYTSREFESSPFDFAQPIAEKPKSSIPSETATPKSN